MNSFWESTRLQGQQQQQQQQQQATSELNSSLLAELQSYRWLWSLLPLLHLILGICSSYRFSQKHDELGFRQGFVDAAASVTRRQVKWSGFCATINQSVSQSVTRPALNNYINEWQRNITSKVGQKGRIPCEVPEAERVQIMNNSLFVLLLAVKEMKLFPLRKANLRVATEISCTLSNTT
jgi:hypothetical protein